MQLRNIFFTLFIVLANTSLLYGQAVSTIANKPDNTTIPPVTVTQFPDLADYGNVPLRNYVRTYQPEIRTTYAAQLTLPNIIATVPVAHTTTTYFDGLGKPVQVVAQGGNGFMRDVVAVHAYDNMGRQSHQYLPYSVADNTNAGRLKINARTALSSFYNSQFPGEPPYSKTVFDGSPLGKVTEVQAPGRNWVGNTTPRGIKTSYEANLSSDQVRIWAIGTAAGDLPISGADYAPGELFVTVITDEDGKVSKEYKDKLGRVVCIRTALIAQPNTIFDASEWVITYQVYDDLSRLRYVLTPQAMKDNANTISGTVATGYCYRYWYDGRGQIIEKQLPGKEAEYYVYDQRNRVVAYQDGNMRTGSTRWQVTVYDANDRALAAAFYNTGSTRSQLSDLINSNTPYTSYSPGSIIYYIKNRGIVRNPLVATTALTDAQLVQLSYYDDYGYTGFPLLQFDNSLNSRLIQSSLQTILPEPSLNTSGLQTIDHKRLQKADGTWGDWLWAASFYDRKGRLIQVQQQNIKGGMSVTTSQYDFTNTLACTATYINNPDCIGHTTTYITKQYFKDYRTGKPTGISQQINNDPWMVISRLQYDDLGRVVKKSMANDYAGGFADVYTYNIRGWLTGINPAFVDNNAVTADKFGPFFGEKIAYDKGFKSKLYNGNIAGLVWKGGPHTGLKRQFYGYTYDGLNRLSHAEYGIANAANTANEGWDQYNTAQPATINFTVSGITYDKVGNLQAMVQHGPVEGPGSAIHYGKMDDLSYYYKASSNQLDYVLDPVSNNMTATPDYRQQGAAAGNYHYDANGNMDQDVHKNITAIRYSHLNKPVNIDINGNKVSYIYDANGAKLQKIVTPVSGTADKWDYLDNFVFKNDVLQYILHDEGRSRPAGTNGSFTAEYFIKDHLGNVRTVVSTATIPYYEPSHNNNPDFGGVAEGVSPGPGTGPLGPAVYTATMEVASANMENLMWNHLNEVRAPKPESWTPEDEMAARLDGSDPEKRIGTAIMLRVMPGDRFALSGEGYYEGAEMSEPAVSGSELAESLLNSLAGGTVGGGTPVAELEENMAVIQHAIGTEQFAAITDILQGASTDPGRPASHLNYVVFDESFNVQEGHSGARQIMGDHSWATVSVDDGINIDQAGYLLVFTSNSANRGVFWDRISLTQYTGSVLEENHYYPFGLTLSSSSVGSIAQPYKYQGIELEKSFGLEIYETFYRGLDPQIGRFMQHDPLSEQFAWQSPYSSMDNNPASNIDPDGSYSRLGAWWRNIAWGGNGISQNESGADKGEWGVAYGQRDADGETRTHYQVRGRRAQTFEQAANDFVKQQNRLHAAVMSGEVTQMDDGTYQNADGRNIDEIMTGRDKAQWFLDQFALAGTGSAPQMSPVKAHPRKWFAQDGTQLEVELMGAGKTRTAIKEWLKGVGTMSRSKAMQDVENAGFNKVYETGERINYNRGDYYIRFDPPDAQSPNYHMHIDFGTGRRRISYDGRLKRVKTDSEEAHIKTKNK